MKTSQIIVPDTELKALLLNGDYAAYKSIYKQYWPILYNYGRKFTKDDFVAEDAVQDALIYIWKKRQTIEIRTSLAAYLSASVRHNILSYIRRQGSFTKYVESLGDFADKGEYITDSTVLENEIQVHLKKAIESLPAKMKRVYQMSQIENLSKEVVAKELNITEATVKKQVENGTIKIRQQLRHLRIF